MLDMPADAGHFRALFYQFVDSWDELISKLRFHCLGIAAQIWWRFELFFNMFPWLFVRLIDPRHDTAETARIFYATFRCCLEEDFSEKVGRLLLAH